MPNAATSRAAALVLPIAAVVLLSKPAHADESPDAGPPIATEEPDAGPPPVPTNPGERLYLEGVALRDAGDADGACAKFYDAMRFSPGPRAMLEEARCRVRAGDHTGALAVLTDARKATAAAESHPAQSEIEQEIRAIMSTTVRLVIDTEAVEQGAWVEYRVDDRTLEGNPAGKTLRVPAGEHVIRAIRPACAQWQRKIEGTAGDRIAVAVPTLRCEGLADAHSTRTGTSKRVRLQGEAASNPYYRGSMWAGGAAGMAFLVALGRSLSENEDARGQAVAAGVFGGVATATAIFLYVRGRKHAAKREAEVAVVPVVDDEATGLVLGVRGSF